MPTRAGTLPRVMISVCSGTSVAGFASEAAAVARASASRCASSARRFSSAFCFSSASRFSSAWRFSSARRFLGLLLFFAVPGFGRGALGGLGRDARFEFSFLAGELFGPAPLRFFAHPFLGQPGSLCLGPPLRLVLSPRFLEAPGRFAPDFFETLGLLPAPGLFDASGFLLAARFFLESRLFLPKRFLSPFGVLDAPLFVKPLRFGGGARLRSSCSAFSRACSAFRARSIYGIAQLTQAFPGGAG